MAALTLLEMGLAIVRYKRLELHLPVKPWSLENVRILISSSAALFCALSRRMRIRSGF